MTNTSRMPTTVLVTGAGRGIGAAVALRCAAAGCDVAINYVRDAASAGAVAGQVRALGRRALLLQAGVSREDEVLAMFGEIDRAWGPLGGLVNNAGRVDLRARLDEMSAERMRRMFEVNVLGSMLCAREAVRRMSTKHGGSGGAIVNLSSVAATLGSPGWYVDYAASKAAIDTFTVGLAREVATEGVRVNCVRPGIVDTEIHASSGAPDQAQRSADLIPMKRPGTPDEIAAAVAWLLGSDAGYATGAIVDIAGGR